MNPETRITQTIMAFLKSMGPELYCWKVHGGPHQQVGIPDICCTYLGRSLWFEVKTETGSLSDIQKVIIRRLEESGARVFVVRSVSEVRKIILDLTDEWS
jgi:hypothetical protein